MISRHGVRRLFAKQQTDNTGGFFERVRDDVHWEVMGSHPYAGTYTSKSALLEKAVRPLARKLNEGIVLSVEEVYLDGNVAVIELRALSSAKNGMPYNNTYCWVCTFDEDGMISRVRAYLDSALLAQVIDQN
ncbi:MAG: nuclear transport factor 2 family protein [Labrenzia sp.]